MAKQVAERKNRHIIRAASSDILNPARSVPAGIIERKYRARGACGSTLSARRADIKRRNYRYRVEKYSFGRSVARGQHFSADQRPAGGHSLPRRFRPINSFYTCTGRGLRVVKPDAYAYRPALSTFTIVPAIKTNSRRRNNDRASAFRSHTGFRAHPVSDSRAESRAEEREIRSNSARNPVTLTKKPRAESISLNRSPRR